MDSTVSTTLIEDAEAVLGSARRTALLASQAPLSAETCEDIRQECLSLISLADHSELTELQKTAADLGALLSNDSDQIAFARSLLDAVVEIESVVFKHRFDTEDSAIELLETIDESFRSFAPAPNDVSTADPARPEILDSEFEVDAELFEVFAEEAEELLTAFGAEFEKWKQDPNKNDPLWEMRRIAHTFKGAAGAVGLQNAAKLAHSIEDDLENVSNDSRANLTSRFESLSKKFAAMRQLVSGTNGNVESAADPLASLSSRTEDTVKVIPSDQQSNEKAEQHAIRKPVVRVSIDALDQLDQKVAELTHGFATILDLLNKSAASLTANSTALLNRLAEQYELASVLQSDIGSIRLVEFGVLTTRFQRAVRVACEDGSKTAEILIENPRIRFDTLVLDALVEPLMHLLRNAVVHGLESSDTRRLLGKAETGLIRIRLQENSQRTTIEISDDGGGIDLGALRSKAIQKGLLTHDTAAAMSETEISDLIFEKGLSTADELSLLAGRGVGMSIVRESIEALNGSIAVKSRKTIGTTFTITLPKAKTSASNNRNAEKKGAMILTVDDSESIRVANRKVIEAAGYSTAVAASGTDALIKLKEMHRLPDLILTDLEMPDMDGFELIAALKADPRFEQIPIVVVSTRVDPEYRTRALRLGAEGCIEKPLDRSKLAIAVDEFLIVRN